MIANTYVFGTYAPPGKFFGIIVNYSLAKNNLAGFCFDALCLDDPIVVDNLIKSGTIQFKFQQVNSQLEGFNIEQKLLALHHIHTLF